MNDLASRAAQYYWFHSIDLGHGVVTKGFKPPAMLALEAEAIFGRVDVAGRSVLDVGAFNGFFSFEAKRRGASRVLATDSYSWLTPGVHGREAFDLAREALGLEVEAQAIDASDLDPGRIGQFDVVLFLGVFYHRYDPLDALAKVAALARHLLIVETHLDLLALDRPAMVMYPGSELANDPTNWWGPNQLCIEALLRGHGFAELDVAPHPSVGARGVFHAWRSTEFRRAPRPDRLQAYPQVQVAPAAAGVGSRILRELRRPFRRKPA